MDVEAPFKEIIEELKEYGGEAPSIVISVGNAILFALGTG